MERKLYRSDTQKVIAGVCGGLSEYFDIDPVIIRLLFVLIVLAGGAGVLVYLIGWIVIPKRPYFPAEAGTHTGTPPGNAGQAGTTMTYSTSSTFPQYLPGLILILVGAVLLIRQTVFWFSWKLLLPIVLVGVGVVLIMRSVSQHKASNDTYQQANLS